MTPAKRLFDIAVALVLGILLAIPIALTALLILIRDGRPVFYISERMETPTRGFPLVKFRTMKTVAQDSGVSGGDKAARITRTGRFLRRARLDEVPQLWNVLKGDISFVGPRPPLRQYVERFPAIYREVLKSRPGITGLASVYFHEHEERLLARARTSAETDEIYSRACVPRKARIDLIYQRHRNICMDAMIMLKTVFKGLR
ncbi:sugar transferase [Rhodobacter sp. SGA-6-6]|uniref:sugar transferase n=1 Tax=Rhodobacter sp. SGA-6-6 TaxID=2710882 RepID=UPI0013EBB431|nr:sugar transferase [Rhodobacter sp. SGA-6-6]NGM44578.1 sugar transferase [Rhodobacter sp. SGA-6-6]